MDATQGAFKSRVPLVSWPTIKSQIERELVLTENFNAHEDTEADNDECQLSQRREPWTFHAGELRRPQRR